MDERAAAIGAAKKKAWKRKRGHAPVPHQPQVTWHSANRPQKAQRQRRSAAQLKRTRILSPGPTQAQHTFRHRHQRTPHYRVYVCKVSAPDQLLHALRLGCGVVRHRRARCVLQPRGGQRQHAAAQLSQSQGLQVERNGRMGRQGDWPSERGPPRGASRTCTWRTSICKRQQVCNVQNI